MEKNSAPRASRRPGWSAARSRCGFRPHRASSLCGTSRRLRHRSHWSAVRLISDSKTAPVAPVMVRFVEQLRQRHRRFSVWNYPRHGGGTFSGRGYSLDFGLDGRGNARGFYPQDEALRFLRAVHETARAVGADWHALYNDFTVADTLNRETGVQHVGFMARTAEPGQGGRRRELARSASADSACARRPRARHGGEERPSVRRVAGPWGAHPPARVPARRPGAPVTRADPETAFALGIAKREVPGLPATTTQALVEPWRQRISPEIPWPILLAFITKESGGQFTDATHGTAKNNWTSPDFYELGIFQTPGGRHGRCTSGKWSSCEISSPGREVPKDPSPWVRQCAKIGADPQQLDESDDSGPRWIGRSGGWCERPAQGVRGAVPEPGRTGISA